MTYCYVFNSEPDGIGIVTDTRLSILTRFGEIDIIPEDYLKVYSFTNRSAIILSGKIEHIRIILEGAAETLRITNESKWYDSFIQHCSQKYSYSCQQGIFAENSLPEIQLIYADIRHRRGSTKCRMVRLEFEYSRNKPKIRRRTALSGEYLSIGWTPQGRRELNVAASNVLYEIESRNLIVRNLSDDEKNNFEGIHGKLSGNAHTCVLDSSGVKDGAFRKTLRKYCKNSPSIIPGSKMHYEPVMIYAAAASKAISERMVELRRLSAQHHQSVGDKFIISTITQKQGLKLYNGEQLNIINGLFSPLTKKFSCQGKSETLGTD